MEGDVNAAIETIAAFLQAEPAVAQYVSEALGPNVDMANEAATELGAVMDKAGLDPVTVRGVFAAMNRAIDARAALAGDTYAAALDQVAAISSVKGNGAVTLVGPGGTGALYAPGTILNLVPAQSGAVLTTPFGLNTQVLIVEVIVRAEDVAADWQIIGNGIRWSWDPYSGFPNDGSLVVWQVNSTGERPLSSIFTIAGPKDGSPITLQIQVILHGAVASPFGGVTLILRDGRCLPKIPALSPAVSRVIKGAQDGSLVSQIIEQVTSKLRQASAAAPNRLNLAKTKAGSLLSRGLKMGS